MSKSYLNHYLKTVEPYFTDIEQGFKNFEVRKRDRPFDVGDTIILQQYVNNRLTGKMVRRKIKYILLDENFVKEGFCILGLSEPITQTILKYFRRILTCFNS